MCFAGGAIILYVTVTLTIRMYTQTAINIGHNIHLSAVCLVGSVSSFTCSSRIQIQNAPATVFVCVCVCVYYF